MGELKKQQWVQKFLLYKPQEHIESVVSRVTNIISKFCWFYVEGGHKTEK